MRKLQSTLHRSFARFLYKFLSFENVQTSENVNLKRGDIACHFSQDDTVHNAHRLDLDLNNKRPGIASDGNFSSYLISRS